MALTTTADVMKFVNTTDTAEEAYLDMLRKGVEEAFKGLTGRRLEAATYTEYLNGNYTPCVYCRETPVNSITSVNLDPVGYAGQASGFGSTTLLTAGTDYFLQRDWPGQTGSLSGAIVKINGTWPGRLFVGRGNLTPLAIPGAGNVKVVYSGGYVAIPDDIKMAIYEACKILRMQRTTVGPIQSEGLGEYNYSALDIMKMQAPFLRPGLEQTVVRYRRLRLQ